jgi:hypothetical protein
MEQFRVRVAVPSAPASARRQPRQYLRPASLAWRPRAPPWSRAQSRVRRGSGRPTRPRWVGRRSVSRGIILAPGSPPRRYGTTPRRPRRRSGDRPGFRLQGGAQRASSVAFLRRFVHCSKRRRSCPSHGGGRSPGSGGRGRVQSRRLGWRRSARIEHRLGGRSSGRASLGRRVGNREDEPRSP